MLHALAQSQSMGKLLYAFKNVRNMDKFLEENASAPDGTTPILTGVRYFTISCVCLHANEDILKGRASAAYERAMTDFESMSDATWHSLLLDVLVRYGTHLTNPEGPAPSAPMLTKHQILQSDNARKEARAASAAAAAAAAESGGDSGGGGGGDGGGDGDGDDDDATSAHGDEAAQPARAAAKAAGGAPKGKPQAGWRKGPRTRTG
jgi:pyruvate/2-oxoglutarate dehydrogenase complex dihydrolipoamide acyltransferase (E2) component